MEAVTEEEGFFLSLTTLHSMSKKPTVDRQRDTGDPRHIVASKEQHCSSYIRCVAHAAEWMSFADLGKFVWVVLKILRKVSLKVRPSTRCHDELDPFLKK